MVSIAALKDVLPPRLRRWMVRASRPLVGAPAVGRVAFGDLRRMRPVSRDFGYDRGLPIDRHYIESFLERQAAQVRGRVLEIGEDTYTRRFGGARVTRADVLHVHDGNPRATFVDDLARGDSLPAAAFDTVILTQTLQLIYEPRRALDTLHRILKPGGALLLTVPGTTPVAAGTEWGGTWYWAFTPLAVQRLLADRFGEEAVEVETHGNVLAATAFLHGIASDELLPAELATSDPSYPVIITARVVKAADAP